MLLVALVPLAAWGAAGVWPDQQRGAVRFDATGDSTEAQADACAIAHGARH